MDDLAINWLDIVILTTIAISALISLFRGFIREAFSLAVWVMAFWLSWSFFRALAVNMENMITTPSVRLGVAFAALMVLSLLVGGLLNYLIIQLVSKTGLSGSDRFIGMIFGAARGVLVIAVLVLVAGLTSFPADPWWRESTLIPYFQELAIWLQSLLPPDIAEKFQFLQPPAEISPAAGNLPKVL